MNFGVLVFFSGALLSSSVTMSNPREPIVLFNGFDVITLAELHEAKLKSIASYEDKRVKNIIAVQPISNGIYTLALDKETNDFAVFWLSLSSGIFIKVQDAPGARNIAISPQRRWVAVLACASISDSCSMRIRSLAADVPTNVTVDEVVIGSTLSWQNDSKIYFEGTSGWIESFDIETRAREKIIKGSNPSLAPSGRHIAFYREKRLLIYGLLRHTEEAVLRRYFWQTNLFGTPAWNLRENLLLVMVHSGIDGQGIDCLVVDVETKKTEIVQEGTSFCAGWLQASKTEFDRLRRAQ